MRENRMKAMLARGEAAFGCSVMIPSPQVVEMVAHAGFDWVLIDMEHGTIGLETAELMIMAAEAAGITPIVRPRSNSAAEITAVMDRGAAGVQVPHVNTADDARRAVASVKFGPGRRGLAAGTRPDRYGLGGAMPEFVSEANRQSLVCVQLEHKAAIDNVDAILAVPDIDVFFIGPSDLSQSMGHPGNAKAEPVAAAIAHALQRILAAGKTPGLPAAADSVAAVKAVGARYIYTHLPKVLGAGARAYFASTRDKA
ncbi:MAG: aldolase/citrate lyase family protein [Hyphomicrobiaceae bacterium]